MCRAAASRPPRRPPAGSASPRWWRHLLRRGGWPDLPLLAGFRGRHRNERGGAPRSERLEPRDPVTAPMWMTLGRPDLPAAGGLKAGAGRRDQAGPMRPGLMPAVARAGAADGPLRYRVEGSGRIERASKRTRSRSRMIGRRRPRAAWKSEASAGMRPCGTMSASMPWPDPSIPSPAPAANGGSQSL